MQNIDKLFVRRHYRENVTENSIGDPVGLAVAKLIDGRIYCGFSLTHPNDHYNKDKANMAAYGRFESGKYSFSVENYENEISSVLPPMVVRRMGDTVKTVLADAVYRYGKFGAKL